jgi:Protein of unknown function (DUF2934)
MEPLEERIRERAYQIWEREGKPHGRDAEHWQQAASEIDAEGAVNAGAGVGEPPASDAARPAASPMPTRRSRAVPRREPSQKRS